MHPRRRQLHRQIHAAGNSRRRRTFFQSLLQSVAVQGKTAGSHTNANLMRLLMPLQAYILRDLIEFFGGHHEPIHFSRRP